MNHKIYAQPRLAKDQKKKSILKKYISTTKKLRERAVSVFLYKKKN